MAPPMLSLLMKRPVVFTQRSDPAAGVDRVDRAVTYVGLEIIENRATILEVDPAEFFRRPSRSAARKKFE